MVRAVSDTDDNPLLTALVNLLPLAPPERQEAILRRALQQVLADPEDHPSRPLVARSPTISTVDSADWAILKPRLRAELDLRGLSLADLARDAGIPLATVQKVLSPKGLVPGRLIASTLSAWLAGRTETANGQEVAASDSGAYARAVAPTTNTNAARHKLTDDERQRLADRLPLINPRVDLGMTAETARKACDGAILPSEVVARVVSFLGGGAAGRSASDDSPPAT
jgi:lambda repressor-like predicted transcriptional regulator